MMKKDSVHVRVYGTLTAQHCAGNCTTLSKDEQQAPSHDPSTQPDQGRTFKPNAHI